MFVPKLIDLKRDPYGTMDPKRGKPTIKTNILKKTPLQTMEDKIRIANKVNKKYKELLNDLDADFKEVVAQLGEEEAEALLTAEKEKDIQHVVSAVSANGVHQKDNGGPPNPHPPAHIPPVLVASSDIAKKDGRPFSNTLFQG